MQGMQAAWIAARDYSFKSFQSMKMRKFCHSKFAQNGKISNHVLKKSVCRGLKYVGHC